MRLCDKIELYTILYDIILRDTIYLLLYYLRTKLTIYIILNIVYLYNLKATVNLKELVNFSFSSPNLVPLCAMRAQLLIKQLTIIINSIWLREHKEVAQVQKIYTYICGPICPNGKCAAMVRGQKTLWASPPNANATRLGNPLGWHIGLCQLHSPPVATGPGRASEAQC